MPRMTVTERKLIAMLKENTGRAICDSGSAYGRNWERNQTRNFRKEPATILERVDDWVKDGSKYEPRVQHNVFHWLVERLTFDSAINRRYQIFAKSRRNDYTELSIMEKFVETLPEASGLYGEGKPMTVNTYNGEDLLSQVIQYVYFEFHEKAYVLLQIHGGCDVRGGYTDAKAFRVDNDCALIDNARADIYGKDCVKDIWSTDDGYHYYYQGSTKDRKLNDYPISRNIAHKGDGEHVYVDVTGLTYSPVSGAQLQAY